MRNVSDKIAEKIKTHILCSGTCLRNSCRLLDNVEKCGAARPATDGSMIERMRFAWRIIKVRDLHSEYAILIAFPLHQWLQEGASTLRYTYIACIVFGCAQQNYSGAGKSLVRSGRKQANVSVRMA
jgi:hypothetical protein